MVFKKKKNGQVFNRDVVSYPCPCRNDLRQWAVYRCPCERPSRICLNRKGLPPSRTELDRNEDQKDRNDLYH